MSSRVEKAFSSSFILWITFALFSCYFLFSIKTHDESKFASLWKGDFKTFFSSLHIPRIKLGIDLQGGTYLVIGVDVEKAIENKLAREKRALQVLIEDRSFTPAPFEMEIKEGVLEMKFEDETEARAAYQVVRKSHQHLSAKQSENILTLTLAPHFEKQIRNGIVEQTINVLQNRLNGFGVSGLIVQRHGERQIVVQLPGVDDPVRVKSLITKAAMLEFKLVEDSARSADDLLDKYDGDLPSDKMIVFDKEGEESGTVYLVSVYPDLTGDHITDARVDFDDFGRVQVAFSLDSLGASQFREITSRNVKRQLGIVIDNVMYSAPQINGEIANGSATIQGNFSAEQASDLSLVLKSGSLQAPLTFEQENRIGASLGKDSIEKGIMSCLIGLMLVFLFSLFYYGWLGFFAMCALVYNLLLILLFLSYFETTLTLPGLAGIVLTIGMAIDASILVYEKMREDLSSGFSFRQAIELGFSGAMTVILDSNITTFLTGLILFKFGGPAIKGFAVTLMAGIIATLLAGVFFLKSLLIFALDVKREKTFKSL